MISAHIIKEQYKRMPDPELIRFAENESQKITPESFYALQSEFIARGLDTTLFDTAQTDRDITKALKLSQFESETAEAFSEAIWKFAFDEKEKGIANAEIYESLVKKQVGEDAASMLLLTMETRAKDLVEEYDTQIIIGWLFCFGGVLLLGYSINYNISRPSLLAWGALLVIGGFIRLIMCYPKKLKFKTIVNEIEKEKQEE